MVVWFWTRSLVFLLLTNLSNAGVTAGGGMLIAFHLMVLLILVGFCVCPWTFADCSEG